MRAIVNTDWFNVDPVKHAWLSDLHKLIRKEGEVEVIGAVAGVSKVDIKITLVMDNLNTHTGASLYKSFEPEVARRLLEKLEFVYTPKHGSWLNIAECEFSVLSRQCLRRRLPI